MSFTRVVCGRQAFVPTATTVATMSMIWMGEQSTTKASTRMSTKAVESLLHNATRKYSSYAWTKPPLPKQQQRVMNFSSKSSSTTTTPVTPTPAAAPTEAVANAADKIHLQKPGGNSFVEWYEGHLHTRPVFTKMCTGCILWGVGDAVAQIVPQMTTPSAAGKEDMSSSSGEEKTISSTTFQYDWIRTGRAAFFGFALHAPTSHVHFNFLEWLTIRSGVSGLGIPIFKAIMEQV